MERGTAAGGGTGVGGRGAGTRDVGYPNRRRAAARAPGGSARRDTARSEARRVGRNAARRAGPGYRGATMKLGTCDPPPAVTLSSAAVDSRESSPSTTCPSVTYGAVSIIRSTRWTRPSA